MCTNYYCFAVPFIDVIVVTDRQLPILSGSSLTLTCTMEFRPALELPVELIITWTGPDETELISYSVKESIARYSCDLPLPSVRVLDAGVYMCTASVYSQYGYPNTTIVSAQKELAIGKMTFPGQITVIYNVY